MAKRKRRKAKSRRHSVSAAPRRRSRRSYARNPQFGGGVVNQAIGLAKDGVVGAVTVVAGEATSRLIRSRVLGMAAGQTMSSVAEAGISVAGGLVVERMFGRQAGRDFVVGGLAGVFRATAKQLGVPFVSEALSDDGPRVLLPRNRAALSSYGRPRLGGYVRSAPVPQLAGETEDELGY